MDSLIFLIWAILFISISFALIGSTYYEYLRQEKKSELFARIMVVFLSHFIVTLITGLPIFVMLFLTALAAAHRPANFETSNLESLSWQQITFSLGICLIYALIGWLLVSFIGGRFIKPWKLFSFGSRKTSSIISRD
jgi:hypothetical protein